MKSSRLSCAFLAVVATLSAESQSGAPIKPLAGAKLSIENSHADPALRRKVVETYGRLPLAFEANQGQTDPQVKFLSRGVGYSLFLTPTEAVMALQRVSRPTLGSTSDKLLTSQPEEFAVLRLKLMGANTNAQVFGQGALPGQSNYFVGKDPQKWHTNVPTYSKVKYEGVYPGIDLVYYGNQRQLEYDFIVAPGADPRRIKFDVHGAKRIRQDAQGELVFKMGKTEVRWHKPVVYQEKDGTRQLVAAHYAVADENRVGFEVAAYDLSRPLYIDPLIYSTFLGGRGGDQGYSIAVDSAGNAYIAGYTTSDNFPTKNPLPHLA